MKQLLALGVFLFSILSAYSQLIDNTIVPYRKGDLWGFSDSTKQILITPQYEYVSFFRDGLAIFSRDKKYGALNKKGEEVIAPVYEKLDHLGSKLLIFRQDSLFGVMNTKGKIIAPAEYSYTGAISEGYMVVKRNGKYGLLSTKGKETVPAMYDQIEPTFESGYVLVAQDSLLFYVDAKNKKLELPEGIIPARSFSEGLAPAYLVYENEMKRTILLINTKGDTIQNIQADDVYLNFGTIYSGFVNGFFALSYTNTYTNSTVYYYINEKGEMSPEFSGLRGFGEGLAAVSFPYSYDIYFIGGDYKTKFSLYGKDCSRFSEGLCAIKQYTDWGYVNTEGKWVIAEKYQSAADFSNGLTVVTYNGKLGVINKNGVEFWEE